MRHKTIVKILDLLPRHQPDESINRAELLMLPTPKEHPGADQRPDAENKASTCALG